MDSAVHERGGSTVVELVSSEPADSVGERTNVRLEEVAAVAGVSTITVSRCFSNPGRVSAKTRDHVLRVAAEMGYIPNLLASSLASSRSMVVAAIVPTISNPIHSMVLQGASDVLVPAGYQLLLGNSHFSQAEELRLVRTFLGHRVDGILLTGKDHSPETIAMLKRSGTPVVEMFDYVPEPIDLSVGSSNYDAGAALGRYLIARNRRNIAFVGHTDIEDSRMHARIEAIGAVCAEAGDRPLLVYNSHSDPGSGAGGEVVGTILRDAPETDAIVFAGHQIAVGAIRYALDVGIDVPGRVAIAAFGDSAITRWIRPALTTVRFPVRETGAQAGRLLLTRLQGGRPGETAIRLGFEILSRESA